MDAGGPDMTVEATVKMQDKGGISGVVGNYASSGSYWVVGLRRVGLPEDNLGRFSIQRKIGGSFVEVAFENMSLDRTLDYHIKATFSGDTITAELNGGAQMLTHTHTSVSNGGTKAGFRAAGRGVQFDDFVLIDRIGTAKRVVTVQVGQPDVNVEATVNLQGETGASGIVGRYVNNDDFWLAAIERSATEGDRFVIYQKDGNDLIARDSAGIALDLNTDYHIKTTFSGSTITAELDSGVAVLVFGFAGSVIAALCATEDEEVTVFGLAMGSGFWMLWGFALASGIRKWRRMKREANAE